jgi:two-component system NarL family sensor kinase
MGNKDVTALVLVTTLIFSLSLIFIVVYIMSYNKRKRKHAEEKIRMKQLFATEIARAELEVMERTMQTIGTDLHDNIGQLLSLTSFTLNSVSTDDPVRSRQKVDSAIELIKKSIKEMRQLGKLLQGEQLLSYGLRAAVEQEIQWLEKSGQFHVSCEIEGMFGEDKNHEKDLIVFRILQEVLNNIIKHAQANLIELSLLKKEGWLTLSVRDNGTGFEQVHLGLTATEGIGLRNIERRTRLIDGEMTIKSAPGEGSSIIIQIPYN